MDESTNTPLSFATIFLENKEKGFSADENGVFEINKLCADSTHLRISHISCETQTEYLVIKRDTTVVFFLHHHEELMNEVIVHGDKGEVSTQTSVTIDHDLIQKSSNKNLADILENIAGVSALRTGSGISKPIVDGMYGNRIAILNNGIAQAGQQWGNDHAPEIDPFVADHISVVKGVSALAYNGNSLGAIILVEPDDIKKEPHLHGNINYIFQSNGLGNTLNGSVQQDKKLLSWRFTGTLKGIGDLRAPDYFLTNTGKKEADFAAQFERKINTQWKAKIFLSSFNTRLGILKGSQIGNLTDLNQAFTRSEPFYTEPNFTYKIESPAQQVNHQLVKLTADYNYSKESKLEFTYSGQLNARKEFDVRRGGRSNIPALSLNQYTHFGDVANNYTFKNGGFLKSGIQVNYVNNTNNPETGILPLIPDYIGLKSSVYSFYQLDNNKFFYEAGARYDHQYLNVVEISRTLANTIDRFTHNFNNYSFSSGIKYQNKYLKWSLNAGYALRSPEINELYSFGLHQGVSSLEIGNNQLQTEKSLKITTGIDLTFNNKLFVQFLGYIQEINDYIFLRPQLEPQLTIRGAFPVFIYDQTKAGIEGIDLLVSLEPVKKFRLIGKMALLKGENKSDNIPLVYMPPANFTLSGNLALADLGILKSNSINLNMKTVAKQRNLLPDQDFLATPAGYTILNFNYDSQFSLKGKLVKMSLKCENLLNKNYRDYLDRQRYYADAMGINFSLWLNYKF